MKKIIIAGAGGAPSEGVIHSLLDVNEETIIGMGSEPTDLILSSAIKKYYVPYANNPAYKNVLLKIIDAEKPALIHFQNDLEIYHASLIRNEIIEKGVKLFMPEHEVIDTCVHKYKTYLKFRENKIKVPENIIINDENDLKKAFKELSNKKGMIWLRSSTIGGGGKGSLPTNDFDFAKGWIKHYDGWGNFVAAEMLSSETVTWLSIWHEGELVVAQTRNRKGWVHGNRSISGVTGVTKVGQTYSNSVVDEVAIQSIKAVSNKPHGIFGVDMTYDFEGIPNPTEINISRFFTTILFFTKAGLNMPKIFKDIALYNRFPQLEKKINPLPDGLIWLRGMDTTPKLMKGNEIENGIITLS
jgi:predicted ATP-grasp superfamily ATP-dependent carboligase